MENASKALIIAGAVLISVLLVSIAVLMLSSASQVVESTESSIATGTVAQFNAQFEKYFGAEKSREQAKALARLVQINNANADNPDIVCPESNTFDNARASQTYTISGTYGAGGYLTSIQIN